ncbi:hypothetical protein ACWD7C_32110 [Streptomyces sp. NPDC005134]|uniref:hypothetical protein n=1 Tax=unclassified Streptomyces TaxID=2593676 RepID=UPI0033AD6FB4
MRANHVHHKTRPADGDRGNRGLIRITLAGTELVAYLTELNDNAHCGWMSCTTDDRKATALRVYDTLAPAIDRVSNVRTATNAMPRTSPTPWTG